MQMLKDSIFTKVKKTAVVHGFEKLPAFLYEKSQ